MSYLDKMVSIFKNYKDANPVKSVKLRTFLTSDKYKNEVERIRSIQSKKERDRLKAQLPAITPSGLFKTKRAATNLVKHSGLIQLDIDDKDNSLLNSEQIKQVLKDLPFVVFCGVSVSGTGVFALVPIAYPEQHKEHFLALEHHMFELCNIVIDRSCKDVCRLRGYSYDEDYYINEGAEVYDSVVEPTTAEPSTTRTYVHINFEKDETFKRAIEIIVMYQLDITGDYPQWFQIMCGIANEYGEAGRSIAHLVSMYSPKYDYEACDDIFSQVLGTNYDYSIGSFYHYFKQIKKL